jgi:hypothetical protein
VTDTAAHTPAENERSLERLWGRYRSHTVILALMLLATTMGAYTLLYIFGTRSERTDAIDTHFHRHDMQILALQRENAALREAICALPDQRPFLVARAKADCPGSHHATHPRSSRSSIGAADVPTPSTRPTPSPSPSGTVTIVGAPPPTRSHGRTRPPEPPPSHSPSPTGPPRIPVGPIVSGVVCHLPLIALCPG